MSIKTSIERLTNRMENVKTRIPGFQGKISDYRKKPTEHKRPMKRPIYEEDKQF